MAAEARPQRAQPIRLRRRFRLDLVREALPQGLGYRGDILASGDQNNNPLIRRLPSDFAAVLVVVVVPTRE